MNTFPTYRRGRRVYHQGPKQTTACDRFLTGLLTAALLLLPPILLFTSERNRHFIYTNINEVMNDEKSTILNLNDMNEQRELATLSYSGYEPHHQLVHGTSDHIRSTVLDPNMDISLQGGLILDRNTEYCQWQEIRKESCQKCTRTVHNDDGTTSDETYECDCVTTYDYIKSWRPYLINSFLFDQPAGHHNPSRNPLPSKTFVSTDARLDFTDYQGGHDTSTITMNLTPQMFQFNNRKVIRGSKKRPVQWVRDGVPPIPSFWKRWMPDRTRFEDIGNLSARRSNTNQRSGRNYDADESDADPSSSFVHVGDGYFFSPYSAGMYENILKYFMQYMDGTLLDWQIGDLMPSCEAGDIRVSYTVNDPSTVSILGKPKAATASSEIVVEPYETTNGMDLGLVHNGIASAAEMLLAEDKDSWWMANYMRIIFLVYAIFASRYLGSALFRRDVSMAKIPTQIALSGFIWFISVGVSWYFVWGPIVDSWALIVGSGALLWYAVQFPPPFPSVKPVKGVKHE
jgi:hypothetical protein